MNNFTPFVSNKVFLKSLVLFCLITINLVALAQKSSSHSPYSEFGIGQMRGDYTPQMRAMGNVSTGLRYLGGMPLLNVSNPASYSALQRTVFEAAMYGNITQLSKGAVTDNTADFSFGQIIMGVPLSAKAGGFAFGLLPFSDVGYSSSEIRVLDTIQYRQSISGEGGLNKAFIGYGISPVKGLSVGANAGFIFGHLSDISSIDFPAYLRAYSSVLNEKREIRGATIDYGAQYFKSLGKNTHITIGYSGSLNNTLTNTSSQLLTRTDPFSNAGYSELIAIDTISLSTSPSREINLPLKHNVGVSVAKGYNWMVGADFKYADWSYFQTRKNEQAMGKDYGFSIGGQMKPDPTSTRYLNQVDYRIGFRYNKLPYTHKGQDINDVAISLGFGFPLPETNFGQTFSYVNISAEAGQLGSLQNSLVRERYINLNFSLNINDTWFRKRRHD